MDDIIYIDRRTGQKQIEKVYKSWALSLFYQEGWLGQLLYSWILPFLVKSSWFSRIYGRLQKSSFSARYISRFVKEFKVDTSEFLYPPTSYRSFNDFFIRKLKPEARPIEPGSNVAVIPADGRYYFYTNISLSLDFIVKGQKFELAHLLNDSALAKEYEGGSLILGRLSPPDYHRFHFPCDCVPGPAHLINGWLYSVNPIAIKKNVQILGQNKRTLCVLRSLHFGKILFMEIGATNVGSIQETYKPGQWQLKGSEKGYFEFGGSAVVLLFTKNTINFDLDLLAATEKGIEIYCLLGQSMGRSIAADIKL